MALGTKYARNARKRGLLTQVKIAMVGLGKPLADVDRETRGWYRSKTIDQLAATLRELTDKLRDAGKLKEGF